jgi:hypothetical protein
LKLNSTIQIASRKRRFRAGRAANGQKISMQLHLEKDVLLTERRDSESWIAGRPRKFYPTKGAGMQVRRGAGAELGAGPRATGSGAGRGRRRRGIGRPPRPASRRGRGRRAGGGGAGPRRRRRDGALASLPSNAQQIEAESRDSDRKSEAQVPGDTAKSRRISIPTSP